VEKLPGFLFVANSGKKLAKVFELLQDYDNLFF